MSLNRPSRRSCFSPRGATVLPALAKFKLRCHKISSKCVEDLLFVEIFAGTARLSKVTRDIGFQALPIDKTTARASQIFIAQYDLTEPESLQAIRDILTTEKDRILVVHLAPACGTASRAREKNSDLLCKVRIQNSCPLRSQKQPMGIDGLSGLGKVRTETANLVYAATAKLIEVCHNLQILCSVETQKTLCLVFSSNYSDHQKIGGHSVSFHNCMHGGARNKLQNGGPRTRPSKPSEFFVTIAMVMPNGTQCQWGKICSSLRPRKQHILTCFVSESWPFFWNMRYSMAPQNPVTLQTQLPLSSTTSHRWVLDMLSKGKKLKPLVSEFKDYVFFLNAVNCDPEDSAFFSTTDSMRDDTGR